jgi:IS605 OrfB family transposase
MQSAGQTKLENEVQDEERQFVHNQLHQLSRNIAEWAQQFKDPVIVLENLKDMRKDIDYGTQMNRRLHSLPFAQLQKSVSYKAAGSGILSEKTDPEYTSQECVDCGHTTRSNRQGKRLQCVHSVGRCPGATPEQFTAEAAWKPIRFSGGRKRVSLI